MNRFSVGFPVGVLIWVASLVGMYFRFPAARISLAVLIALNVLLVSGFFYALMTGRAEAIRRVLKAYPALTGLVASVLSMFYLIPCALLFWLDL